MQVMEVSYGRFPARSLPVREPTHSTASAYQPAGLASGQLPFCKKPVIFVPAVKEEGTGTCTRFDPIFLPCPIGEQLCRNQAR